ncbi:hypothetical protein GCM10009601_37160 [Streptomyces thermospinosisporus]|uniref:Uncharacterized protein n=1 Tax=Streptomyces thermospinosisporus TaxID=161482 RepID=A0ABP4JS70_9ACTN
MHEMAQEYGIGPTRTVLPRQTATVTPPPPPGTAEPTQLTRSGGYPSSLRSAAGLTLPADPAPL